MAAAPETSPAASVRVTWRTIALASASALGMVLASLDFAVNVGLPAMRDAFGTDLAAVQWVIVVFIATRAGLALGAGAFADRFGLRMVYLFGTVTYLASMVCMSLSPTLEYLVGFRVLQALGTGCLYSTAPAIAASVFPEHRRGLSMGFTSASLASGMVMSTLAAGPLVQLFDWPAVFWGRIPLATLALGIGLLAIPSAAGLPATLPAARPRFDVAGAALTLSLLLCLMIGLRLGQAIGWASPIVVALLTAAPIVLAALVWVERRAESPVLPGALARLSGFQTATGAMFLGHFSQFVIWFIFPFYVTDSLGRSPVTLGILFAIMSTCNILSSPVGGWLCDRWGVRPVGAIGLGTHGDGIAGDVGVGRRVGNLASGGRNRHSGPGRGLVPVGGLRIDAGQRAVGTVRHGVGRHVAGAGVGDGAVRGDSGGDFRRPERPLRGKRAGRRSVPAGLPGRVPYRSGYGGIGRDLVRAAGAAAGAMIQ